MKWCVVVVFLLPSMTSLLSEMQCLEWYYSCRCRFPDFCMDPRRVDGTIIRRSAAKWSLELAPCSQDDYALSQTLYFGVHIKRPMASVAI